MKERILFIDDDPTILSGLRRLLHHLRDEWDMSFASSGEEALGLIASKTYDVIVTDMRMPNVNGAQLLKEVRDKCPCSVRIILSGEADLDSVLESVVSAHQYLAKPTSPDILKPVILRATQLRSLVGNKDIQAFVSQIDALPSYSKNISLLRRELQKDTPSLEMLQTIIAQDISLAAKVLQITNSAFFGEKQEVYCPYKASAMLGVDLLRMLIERQEIIKEGPDDGMLGPICLNQLNQHSVMVATLARRVAAIEGVSDAEIDTCLATGLLHDIGKIILALYDPEKYERIIQKTEGIDNVDLQDEERACFQTTHAEVGAFLLGLWGLPQAVIEAAYSHFALKGDQPTGFSIVTAVQIANLIVDTDLSELVFKLDNEAEFVNYKKKIDALITN